MAKLIYIFSIFIFLLTGKSLYGQGKQHFPHVGGILQNIVPDRKADSWMVVHKNYGKDTVIKQSGVVKDYISPASGFNMGIASEDESYYIVYSSGGKTEYITDLIALKDFVGKIDNIYDAAAVAAADGYIVDEDFRDMAGNYREDRSFYHLDLGKITSAECPYQKKHFTLTVERSTGKVVDVKDNGSYIELYNKKCKNNPRLLKIEKQPEEPKDESKKPAKAAKRK